MSQNPMSAALIRAVAAAAVITAMSVGEISAHADNWDALVTGAERYTNRPGSDYKVDVQGFAHPGACQNFCLADEKCKSWTWVRPGVQHKNALCYLKNAVPAPVPDTCCISGVRPDKARSGVTEGPSGIAPSSPSEAPINPPQSLPEQPPSPPQVPPASPLNPGADRPYGLIGDKYAALGGADGPLGQPSGGEAVAPHGGRCQQFRHGTICWHPEIGEAFGVWGLIHAKWSQLGRTEFGYPITDERTTPDGRGRFNHFRGMPHPGRPESSIYWTPQTGAHAIYGLIRDAWAKQGWERGPLGYPTSDEYQDGKFRRVNFERGHILWSRDTGVRIVR